MVSVRSNGLGRSQRSRLGDVRARRQWWCSSSRSLSWSDLVRCIYSAAKTTSCAPASSPACTSSKNLHDVSILAPFTNAEQGQLIPVTAILSAGETASQFKFNYGDGASYTGTTPTASHSYANPDELLYAQALVGGIWHDNLFGNAGHHHHLVPHPRYPRHPAGNLGNPECQQQRFGESDRCTGPGGTITVVGSYTSNSSNPTYGLITPSSSCRLAARWVPRRQHDR